MTDPTSISFVCRHRTAMVMACCLTLIAVVRGEEAPTIRIGLEVNSPPLSFVEAEGRPQGFTPELLRAMEATGQVKFEIVPGYWSQILTKFQTGQLDALANVQILAERRETMAYSIAHASLHAVTYTRPEAVPVTASIQFVDKKMATLAGTTSQRNAAEHHGWGAQIMSYPSWQAMLQAVKAGECDFALVMRPLSLEQPDEFGLHREFVDDILREFHIAVHHGNHAALERINEALAEVIQSEAMRELEARWIGPVEPQPIRLVDLRPYYLHGGLVLALTLGVIWWQRWHKVRWRELARKLQVSRDMLNSTGRIARVGGWEMDLQTQRVFWSDETCHLHAVKPGATPSTEEAINYYAPECRPTIRAAVQAALAQGTPWDLELELIDAQGRRFWARAQGVPEFKDGKVVRLHGAFHDIDESKRNEQVQEFLAQTAGGSKRESFFLALARFLARSLQVDFVCVDRLLGDQLSARTLAVWCDGRFEDNVTYTLADTPCGQVVGQVVCCYPRGVAQLFPRDQALQDLRGEGYIGVTLFDHLGQPIGLIAAISRQPLDRLGLIEPTMKLVAVRAAAELERMNDEEALQVLLKEKEALLKEVHHRVKNNLQVITSLLRLESAKRTDPDTKAALRDMQTRIRSMALLHETLYRSGNFAQVDLGVYLRSLGTQLFRAQDITPNLVQLGFELSPVKVDIDQAIPCGLIVNELLTNALKYGFPEGRTGNVRLGLSRTAAGEVELMVSDDGIGLPAGLDIKQSKSLGLRLITDLVRQLQGTLEIGTPAQFTIRFKPKTTHDVTPPPLATPTGKVQPKEAP